MGEGGTLLLVNGTPYAWEKADSASYQMNSWSFPGEIKPGTKSEKSFLAKTNQRKGEVASIYVEFKQTATTKRSDTAGNCTFTLKGTQACAFRIEVKDAPSNLSVQLQNIETPNNPKGSLIQLGWRHDGVVCFILSGKEGKFSSSNPPRDWMHQNLRTLGARPLHKICVSTLSLLISQLSAEMLALYSLIS